MKVALREHSALVMVFAAVIFAFGLIMIVGTLSTLGLRSALTPNADESFVLFFELPAITGLVLTIIGIGVGGYALLWIEATEEAIERPPTYPYSTSLIGMGYALILIGTLQFVALAGFTSEGQIAGIFGQEGAAAMLATEGETPATNTPENGAGGAAGGAPGGAPGSAAGNAAGNPPGNTTAKTSDEDSGDADARAEEAMNEEHRTNVLAAMRLLLLPGFAILGGLFFVAGALSAKQEMIVQELLKDGIDTFDYHRFWAGVSYRMGEAIVFALVVFLFVRWNEQSFNPVTERMVLLSALVLGMFVKPAELLINGLAQRLFAAIDAFVK